MGRLSIQYWTMAKNGRKIVKIFVGSLSYDLTDAELKTAFEAFGEVESATIINDRDTGRSKGFGFVEMLEKKEALKAIEELNSSDLGGRTIAVNEARPKPKSNHRPGGFGGPKSGHGGGRSGGYGGGGGGKPHGGFSKGGGRRGGRPGGSGNR